MITFERSATEQEIIEGALEADPQNAFSYFREVDGLPQNKRAEDFIDLKNGAHDPEAGELLNDIKPRIREHLPDGHHHELRASWTGDGVSDEHLDRLCELV